MHAMHLSSLIDLSLVFLKSPLQDVHKIYAFMVNHICKMYQIESSEAELVEKLSKRKFNEGILFPTGTAIPHLHLENFNDTLISVLIPENPIVTEFGTVKIFFLVLTGKKDNSLYLHILQSIIKLSKDSELFKNILNVKTAHEFLNLLKTGDFSVKRAVTVSDIMNQLIITVEKDTTLKELSHLFYEHNFGYFPVIDENDKLIGEVTVLDYIMTGFPAYTSFLNNMNFLKSFEPFERLLRDEHDIRVESIMKPIEVSLSPDTSIFEAVFLMNKFKRRDIPVLSNGKLAGVISFMDVFRKLIKG